MSKENETQSFISGALENLIKYVPENTDEFEELAVKYIKASYRNGAKAGYQDAYKKIKESEAEGK